MKKKEFGKWFIQQLKNIKHISVDEKVHDGQMILNNECQVVATPGHTLGHISLYFSQFRLCNYRRCSGSRESRVSYS